MKIDLSRYDAITFDCYGTLIDWDTGVANFVGPWAVENNFPGKVSNLIGTFAKYQYEQQQATPFRLYPTVLAEALKAAVTFHGAKIDAEACHAFGNSVGTWPAFIDTIDGLRWLKSKGLHLGVVSNVDDASFAQTHHWLGQQIDTVVTAEMVGAYKPNLNMFERLFKELAEKGISQDRVLHLAQSRFHDVAPGNEIGLDVIWIDRRHGRPGQGVNLVDQSEPLARFENLESFCELAAK